ncbi:IF factor, partial [Centropus bengalensis]|nr:IF factor [Centropus bengalensis]
KNHGMIGNIYSMGLVLQALDATRQFYAPRNWDCHSAFSVVYKHDYTLPMAISQVLPAMVGKSYLDAAKVDCASKSPAHRCPCPQGWIQPSSRGRWSQLRSRSPPRRSSRPAGSIVVHYVITNTLKGQDFSFPITVHVPAGSTLLRVLQQAEKEEPEKFSFKTEETSWGPMVISIHGLAGNTNDRTYWQFFSGKEPLQEGVGTYKPHNGEHIEAIFSTY